MPRTTERRSAIAADGRGPGLADRPARGLGVGLELLLGHAQAHRHGDQPGLGAVVQVALEPAQLGRGVVHRLGPAAGQHLDPLLEHLGAAGGEQQPVDLRAQPHQLRVGAEPPEEAGGHREQQHHHDAATAPSRR